MQTLTFLFAFIAVLALIGVAAWLVRRFANNRLGANTQRGRMPRLAVIDAAAVDGRRRLVLVRRDNVEHLLMIGGPSDIVVEPNIVRAMPNREQMAPRPAVGEQPPRIAPLPDVAWNDEATKSDSRSTDDHHEPQMPEPPPRPARPTFADDIRRPAPPPTPERRSDPLTGFAPESISGRPEQTPPRLGRNEPLMPRPQRELPKVPPVREAPPIRDVLPGRYSSMYIKPTTPGKYHLFCAEYCGTQHSGMGGWIYVMEPGEYENWLSGGPGGSMQSRGEQLFQQYGCASCHRSDGKGRGPSLVGIFNQPQKLQGGGTVIADEAYIRESILTPKAKVVQGFQAVMPTFQGQISEESLLQLIAYIKSLEKPESEDIQ